MAIHRYQHFCGQDPGLAKGMRYENGITIDMEQVICRELENASEVWVMLKEDIALMEAENTGAHAHLD